jgi:hypothetical protein
MFDRIKKAFARQKPRQEATRSILHAGPVSEWAATQGFGFSVDDTGRGIALEGKVGGRPWRLQLGRPSRNYIFGDEVRARAELGVDESVAVLVMNRPLKQALGKRAYELYTNDLRTSVDGTLPEEMRWLAMYDEVGWDSLPNKFWARLSVLTDNRATAQVFLDQQLADTMLNWPSPGPSPEVPFMVMLLNGKAYLRMEYTPADLTTLQHAARIFTMSCENALSAFRPRA